MTTTQIRKGDIVSAAGDGDNVDGRVESIIHEGKVRVVWRSGFVTEEHPKDLWVWRHENQ